MLRTLVSTAAVARLPRAASAAMMSTAGPSGSIDDVRQTLLSTALSLVPEHSFTDKAIAEAAKLHNFPPTIRGLAPHGTRDLIEHLFEEGISVVRAEHELLLAENPDKKPGMTKTVTHLSRKRLEFMAPYIQQWPEAVKVLAHPTNVPFALHHLHKLVDEMWFLAGDKSYDTNYYTKRALLAGVYSSTELFMTTDRSPGYANTWAFLDARFKDSAKIGKASSQFKTQAEWAANNLKGILMSRGVRF
ncbi:Ubiquinone biosynthesis protein coq9, mitochondrial [Blastocladiella emersonii ATCC 22665]|nr:Ubiquinone biosynthesis protein coq9, mitochondrial [Blastocladiella emersonii ATCC 22665]